MSGDDFSDSYVAKLLQEDARASSTNYHARGIGAFLPKRQTGQAPKPNLRFLQNIIKETDSHNSALSAKEHEESRRSFRRHERQRIYKAPSEHKDPKEPGTSEWGHKRRSRHSNEFSDDSDKKTLKHRKKRRHRSRDRHGESRGRNSKPREREPSFSPGRDLPSKHPPSRRGRRRSRSGESNDSTERRRGRDSRRKISQREAERSVSHDVQSKRQRRHLSPVSKEQRSHRKFISKNEDRELESVGKAFRKQRSRSPQSSRGSNSDPLDSVIGPMPLPSVNSVRRRGRGHLTSPSAMDSHFVEDYDPSGDVRVCSDENDWDQALEALRDRQRWKKQGGDRLKAAGFTDEEIQKWEKGGEKGESDVRWAKKGEGREWDRGKVVDNDGYITHEAEWGRLK